MKKNRTATAIKADDHLELNRKAENALRLGALFAELRAVTHHGDFEGDIKQEFDVDPTTARRYMKAHAFAEQHLKSGKMPDLTPSAIYRLAQLDDPSITELAIEVAKKKRVGPKELRVIIERAQSPEEQPSPPEEQPPTAEDDLPPPPVTEPPQPPTAIPLHERFAKAVQELWRLRSTPAMELVGVMSPGELELLGNLLKLIAAVDRKHSASVEDTYEMPTAPLGAIAAEPDGG